LFADSTQNGAQRLPDRQGKCAGHPPAIPSPSGRGSGWGWGDLQSIYPTALLAPARARCLLPCL